MSISTNPIALDETLKMTNEKLEELASAIENEKVSMDIPIATKESLGAVKIGENLEIDEDGTLSSFAKATGYTELNIDSGIEYNNIDNPMPNGDNYYLLHREMLTLLYNALEGKEGYYCGNIKFKNIIIRPDESIVRHLFIRYECKKNISDIPNEPDYDIEDYQVTIDPLIAMMWDATLEKEFSTKTKKWYFSYESQRLIYMGYMNIVKKVWLNKYISTKEIISLDYGVNNKIKFEKSRLVTQEFTDFWYPKKIRTTSTGQGISTTTVDLSEYKEKSSAQLFMLCIGVTRESDNANYSSGVYIVQLPSSSSTSSFPTIRNLLSASAITISTAADYKVIITPTKNYEYSFSIISLL